VTSAANPYSECQLWLSSILPWYSTLDKTGFDEVIQRIFSLPDPAESRIPINISQAVYKPQFQTWQQQSEMPLLEQIPDKNPDLIHAGNSFQSCRGRVELGENDWELSVSKRSLSLIQKQELRIES